MSIKENILNMPAWKAFVCALLIIFTIGVVFEEILAHTVFHVIDRMIVKMEVDKQDDIDDLNDMNQRSACDQYKELLRGKEKLAKRSASDISSPDYDLLDVKRLETYVSNDIKNHNLNLSKCQKWIKEFPI